MVQRGEFRADLWYRLAVFPLVLPPLRERAQDIPALVEMLVQRASRHFGCGRRRPRAADLALLAAYDWPGNVRELGSVIDRAVILGGGRRLEVAKALGHAGQPCGAARGGTRRRPRCFAPGESTAVVAGTSAPATLDEAMARHIRAALAATHGPHRGAARRGQTAEDQPAHAAGADAETGYRLAGVPPGTRKEELRRRNRQEDWAQWSRERWSTERCFDGAVIDGARFDGARFDGAGIDGANGPGCAGA